MSKSEFLDKLRVSLNGKVSPSLVEENIRYYNEYIQSQIAGGRSEEEVMEHLGDPRLIARTIVQTNGSSEGDAESTSYRETIYDDGSYSGYGESSRGSYSGSYDSNAGSGYNGGYYNEPHEVKVRNVPGWLAALLVILVVVCVLGLVFSLISFMMPLIIPILIVLFLVKLFRDWLN